MMITYIDNERMGSDEYNFIIRRIREAPLALIE
jgi:hypothetical protein